MTSPAQFITKASDTNSPLQPLYEQAKNYHNRRLWHQLTETLVQIFSHDYFTNEKNHKELQALYNEFIKSFEEKISKLRLAQFAVAVSQTMTSDLNETNKFLEEVLEKVKEDNEANIYVLTAQASVKLSANEQKECFELLGKAQKKLSDVVQADILVTSTFYKVLYEYYKLRTDALQFYNSALTYLAHVELETLPKDSQKSLATDLALAALIGDKIYNFGDLLNHPIFSNIQDSWLGQLLRAVNAGDIDSFDKLKKENKAEIAKQSGLVEAEQTLREKVSVLALMTLALGRSANERTLSFEAVAKASRLQIDEVELLVMKGLALGLIRGTIDQVDRIVTIDWVQPRVLDMQQLELLSTQLNNWAGEVAAQSSSMQSLLPQGVLV